MAPAGQTSPHSVQKRQRPRSMASSPRATWIAWVGQTSAHSRHPSGQADASIRGRPRKRSGKIGSSTGKGVVR